MNWRDLPAINLTFELTLREPRERIRVTMQITAAGRGPYFTTCLLPWFPHDEFIAQVTQTLNAEAQAAANRWALSYASIDEAHLGQAALTAALMTIESTDFTVSRAIVAEILPLTPKVPPPEPPPPPPPAQKTPSEKVIEPLAEMMTTLTDFLKFVDQSYVENAHLHEHKLIGQRLRNKLDNIGQRIIFPSEKY